MSETDLHVGAGFVVFCVHYSLANADICLLPSGTPTAKD